MKVPRLEIFDLLITSIKSPTHKIPTAYVGIDLVSDFADIGVTTDFSCCDPCNGMWMLRHLLRVS
jgi:hypothetical protein